MHEHLDASNTRIRINRRYSNLLNYYNKRIKRLGKNYKKSKMIDHNSSN